LEGVEKELCVAGRMLVSVVEGDDNVDIKGELEGLFEVDEGLRRLFGMEDR
jgi:hypothetical protein